MTDGDNNYSGSIPIADLMIGTMIAGQERRSQGADYGHEFLRLKSAENSDKMNQAQSLGFRLASESGANRTRAETNNPGNTGAPGGT